MSTAKKINWLNTLFLTINPLIAVVGTIFLAYSHLLHWKTVILAIILAVLCGLSVTGGYHRLFSHKSYSAAWPVRLVFLLFGAATFEGSVLDWCTDHRNHHLYTDTPKDPYSIKGGFWHAHIGWLFTLDPSKRDYSNVNDLKADPLVQFQHKFYVPLAILMGYVLPIAITLCWGDWLGGLIIASCLRITYSQHSTFFINSVCHMFGKLTYSTKQTARDNWITALFTFGEGYHNFHHQFPIEYRNAVRFYQFDPTKWLIRTLAIIGLATDLKTISKQKILQYKIMQDKKNIGDDLKSVLHTTYENMMTLISNTDHLEKAYRKLKQMKLSDLSIKADEYKASLKKHHMELKLLKARLKEHTKQWNYLIANYQVS